MKRYFLAALAVAMSLLFTGCVGVAFNAGNNREMVRGSGAVSSVEYPVQDYDMVLIETGVELIYSSEKSDKIVVEIHDNLVEYLDIKVEDGVLIIDAAKHIASSEKTPKVYISNPNFKGLSVGGYLDMPKGDKITGESFLLDVAGAASVEMEFDVDRLEVVGAGAADLTLLGRADRAEIEMSGAGKIRALGLQTKDAVIDISGAGDLQISCSDNLEVNVAGAGNVSYRGDPHVRKSTSGFASVDKIG